MKPSNFILIKRKPKTNCRRETAHCDELIGLDAHQTRQEIKKNTHSALADRIETGCMLKYSMSNKRIHFCALLLLLFSCSGCDEEEPTSFSTRQAKVGEDGSECLFDNECHSGKCETTFNLGYCTSDNCEKSCTGEDAFCLEYLSEREQCVDGCRSSAECRAGYDCIQVYDKKSACLPKKHRGPTSGQLGAACEKKSCHPGLACLGLNDKGYCAGDCNDCEDGVCTELAGADYCLASCGSSRECQLNDRCVQGACLPQESKPQSLTSTRQVLGIMCEPEKVSEFTYEFKFRLKPDTKSFSITPVMTEGNLKILEIEKDGKPFELATTYRHHNQRLLKIETFPFQSGYYGVLPFDWTVIVPYSPQFINFIDTDAAYLLRVKSHVGVPCFYRLESSGGSKLGIDLYFASDLFSEEDAEHNKDLKEILSVLTALYQKAGIEISQIRYHDLSAGQKARFAKTDISDVGALTALGRAQGDSLDDFLRVDVFMVDEILGGPVGMSPSIPGAPGLHGNPNNGLVFSVVDAGFDNEVIGYIMAHEIGHYLGLRHTSEKLIGDTREYIDELVGVKDPILDTPSCGPSDSVCPDRNNLMYPSIPDIDDRVGEITQGQGAALRANPMIRK